MSNEKWLSNIPGHLRLSDIVLPGSHDAGVYSDSISLRKGLKATLVRCQGGNIAEQAAAGSRMFDCRVFLKKVGGGLTPAQLVPTMGHFTPFSEKWKGRFSSKGETGRVGGYGGSLLSCVNDAVQFVKQQPTEFLILRFSHTYCPEEVGQALDQYLQIDNNINYVYRAKDNIARQRIADLRGKVIMVFASEFHKGFHHSLGYLPFFKHKAGKITDTGLCTCGIYDGSKKIANVGETAEKSFDEHKNHAIPDHLHFVYWQQTGGNVEANTKAPRDPKKKTGGTHANLPILCGRIRDKVAKGEWKLPNVISHDFVTEATCSEIINLNYPDPRAARTPPTAPQRAAWRQGVRLT